MQGLNCGHIALNMGFLLLICILPVMALGNSFTDQRVSLRRVDDQTSMSFTERFQSAMERSKRRVEYMSSMIKRASELKSLDVESGGDGAIQTTVVAGDGEYLMEIGLGNPVVTFQGIADTGSDLLWTQCKPCRSCFNQSTPIFDPSKSSTYDAATCDDPLCSELGEIGSNCNRNCGYTITYGDGSSSSGVLSYDTVTIGSGPSFKHIAFGCAQNNNGNSFQGSGLVGLGRGPLSLVSQLGSNIQSRFSYCLVDMENPNASSPLFFGKSAMLKAGKSLRLKKNPLISTFWYVPMTGVTVDGQKVDIPSEALELQNDGTGGMIIDSGTTITYFVSQVYKPIQAAIKNLVDLPPVTSQQFPGGLCYQLPSDQSNISLPSVVFKFEGGVDMDLPAENTYVKLEEDVFCLSMTSNQDNFGILGNIQQKNFHFLYDDAQNRISFETATCASL
ncbi:aspartic proteinase nepenthesin-1 [Cryptomeria japonica]|uniref:aspartic proteinase nepenthesin-1 n=1 Tax=Cryptomeria japonica TaxID=3369 RepID=UPI0027DA9590|nr:aspartic proteinase nepenthesin-1 [Cryptomeria japonica]